MELPAASPLARMTNGLVHYLRHVELSPYRGTRLYPVGPEGTGDNLYAEQDTTGWHYSNCLGYDVPRIREKAAAAPTAEQAAALEALATALQDYPRVGGYTHSIPHYDRLLAEGLDAYRERMEAAADPARTELYTCLLALLEGISAYHARVVAVLEESPQPTGEGESRRRQLLAAFGQVPSAPVRSFAEAMICMNFILHLDGTDNLGRFDQFMLPFYEASRTAGEITPEEAREWIGELWGKLDRATGWNVAVGGLRADGTTAVNELTRLCLEAATGRRRPNLALRIPPEMPEEVWEATFDCLASGGGLPALYNEQAYLRAIRAAELGVSEEDLAQYAFGGCTELMIHGKSNVGSLEGDLNLPEVLVASLHRRLADCATYEEFWAGLREDFAVYIRQSVEAWNRNQESKARWQPQPMRTLLIDDCIEKGREYNAGGARYNWCVVNVMGLANVADSLAALRQVVYEQGGATREELLTALAADFAGDETLRRRLALAPHFGNDDPYVDEIMRELSTYVFEELRRYTPWRGGRYLPACLMFVTYAQFGKPVGATPDGRHAGQPIADSAGAMQGRDVSGPTALLRSVAKIPHELAPGTLVVNIRLAPQFFRGEQRRKLRDLLLTYFELGGMQLQMTVVDQAVLQAAMAEPEKYGDLIIRVGGYSEYWSRLDTDVRRAILERVEHG
jgi:formate C-acetyltransferase